ncbi:MAG TPA: dihydropteroate synthase [Polyangia bacterium]|nr:dihydropteroate synthase [Polyangia bacterium]
MSRCLIVGVLNSTPDSFSDGGQFRSVEEAVEAGVRMAGDGADWIDVGGESTRPGAKTVGETEEQMRVLPVIEGLRKRLRSDVLISVDTYRASTARAALAAGARVVNDISGGLLDPDILEVTAEARGKIVLGHLRGRPSTMMEAISFEDVVHEVADELGEQIKAARKAGCEEVWADPGIGFGKALEHNVALLRGVAPLRASLGVPLMVGVSRKSFIGQITGKPVAERVFGTAGAVAAAVLAGASAVRVHDVGPMRDVVRVAEALAAGEPT